MVNLCVGEATETPLVLCFFLACVRPSFFVRCVTEKADDLRLSLASRLGLQLTVLPLFFSAPLSRTFLQTTTHICAFATPIHPPTSTETTALVARRAELIMMTKKAFNPSDATAKCPLGIRRGRGNAQPL